MRGTRSREEEHESEGGNAKGDLCHRGNLRPPSSGGEDPHGLGRDTGDMRAERLHEGMTTPPALPAN